MFTGIIEDVGRIRSVAHTPSGTELEIQTRYTDLQLGESVSVNGVCLTVFRAASEFFTVAAMITTRERTTVPRWAAGRRVNLERAVNPGSRLSGHVVQGHVDAVGEVASLDRTGDALMLNVRIPDQLAHEVVLHGSIALDGVSLTVNALTGDQLQVALVDYTLQHTALADLAPGDHINVETDVIGKYVRRQLEPYLSDLRRAQSRGDT